MSARRVTATLSAVFTFALLVVLAWPDLRSTFEPPSREGPIGLVTVGDEPMLWLMTRQEEERSRHVGGGTRSIGRWVTDHYLHFRLQAHDARDAGRRWLRDLRVVKDDIDTHGRQARIFGQQGEVVWVWVCDEVLALDARDGHVLADRVALERINPDLAGLLPRDLQFHAWYGGLVINLVDGRRVRLRSDGFIAEPFTIDDDNAFRHATSLSTTWNGFYQTKDFGVRAGTFDGHWIGLFSDAERRDAIDDGFGDHYRNADEVLDENFGARRRFWRAEADRTREFSEGDHPRIRDLVAIDGAKTYLEGRLLKAPDVPGAARGAFTRIGIWKAAARLPVIFDDGGRSSSTTRASTRPAGSPSRVSIARSASSGRRPCRSSRSARAGACRAACCWSAAATTADPAWVTCPRRSSRSTSRAVHGPAGMLRPRPRSSARSKCFPREGPGARGQMRGARGEGRGRGNRFRSRSGVAYSLFALISIGHRAPAPWPLGTCRLVRCNFRR